MKLRYLIQIGVVLASLLLISCSTSAQWIYLGLNDEIITTVCPDPNNDNVILVGSLANFTQREPGKIFKSTNYGTSWDTILTGVSVMNILISPFDSNVLYAALGTQLLQPGIIKSTDGGTSWFKSDSGIYTDWEIGVSKISISPISSNVLFASTGGTGGWVYKTTNSGDLWYRCINTSVHGLANNVAKILIDPDSSQYMYAVNHSVGDFIKSYDHGETWVVAKEFLAYGNDMEFGENNDILYIGANPSSTSHIGFFKTTDRGESWENFGNGFLRDYVRILSVVSTHKTKQHGIYVSIYSYNKDSLGTHVDKKRGVYFSSDGGMTWEDRGLDSMYIVSSEVSSDENTLYAGVFSSFGQSPTGIYKLDLTTVVSEDETKPSSQYTLIQNYPNPFNPTTQITYSVPKATDVTIKIFDVLGREIAVLVNERKQPGEYNITWNAEYVPSGVYFYRITAGEYIETKKMAVVR